MALRRSTFITLAMGLIVAGEAGAQVTPRPSTPAPAAPKTQVQGLLAREGVLMTSRVVTFGTVVEQGAIRVEAIRAWELGREAQALKGAQLTVTDAVHTFTPGSSIAQYRTELATLDADEVSGLLKAIDQMTAIMAEVKAPAAPTGGVRAAEEVRVLFRTRDAFVLTVFGGVGGFKVALSAGHVAPAVAFLSSKKLDELRGLVELVQLSHLDVR